MPGDITMPLLRTIDESTEILRVSRTTLYREIRAGRLEAVKVNGSTRIRESELRRYVEGLTPASS